MRTRDRHRGRGRLGDGRLLPSAAAATRGEPENPAARVHAIRPGGRADLRDLRGETMGGDYTRFTFKPQRDHAGVLMQQGRVQLDSDWNEWVEMIDRRLLAETLDLSGRRCGVPRTTPRGFRIGRDADD